MPGLFGVVSRTGPIDGDTVAAMDRALHRRGPPGGGTLLDGPCALGVWRPTADPTSGDPPVASEDRALWAVASGAIDNHRALRAALASRGHRFAGSSDLEVIPHLYEEHGDAFAARLRGPFACAVWDRRARTLTLARDPLGLQPLLFADTPRGLVFASELHGLLAHPWVARRLDPAALCIFFTHGQPPPDRAIVRGVQKLPPGHLLVWSAGRSSQRRFAALRPAPAPATFDQAVDRARALLAEAVAGPLDGAADAGVLLSGGPASATLAACLAARGARPRTFSVAFEGVGLQPGAKPRVAGACDAARAVAERLGARHEERIVGARDAAPLLDELLALLDEPFADPGALAPWLAARFAAGRAPLLLSGDGGAALFALSYKRPRAILRLPALMRALAAIAARFTRPPPPHVHHQGRSPALIAPHVHHQGRSPALLAAPAFARLLTADLAARALRAPRDPAIAPPPATLARAARLALAPAPPVRSPFLDVPLVEALAGLPAAWKRDRRGRPILLARALAGLAPALPEALLTRPPPAAAPPLAAWLRGPLRAPTRDLLTDGTARARGLFDPRAVTALLDRHESGRADESPRIFALLVLELWQRARLDPQTPLPREAIHA
jgi:asparagine synthase (glutamine-hydrolysing)